MRDRFRSLVHGFLLVVGLIAVAVIVTTVDAHAGSPPSTMQTAIVETFGGVDATDGYCIATNGTTTIDMTNYPAGFTNRLSAEKRARIRWLQLRFFAGAASTRVCHAVGGGLPATSCDALDVDAVGVLLNGESARYTVNRDWQGGTQTALQVQANAGTDGVVCLTVGY